MAGEITIVLLAQGDRGPDVRTLQEQLAGQGFDPGPLDGIYGPRTAQAVLQFQQYVGLPGTGDLDEVTWAVLRGDMLGPAQQPPSPSAPIAEVLREPSPGLSPPILEAPQLLVPMAEVLREPSPPAPPAAPSAPVAKPRLFDRIQQVVADAGARFGVDPLLILAVIRAESSFDPNARNFLTGAAGLMQLTPIAIQDLAERFGVVVSDPFDPAQNILGGTALLKGLLGQFGGDVSKAVAAFHAGATRVLGWIQKKGEAWLTAAGSATRRYVQNVVSAWQFASTGGQPADVLRASFTEPYGPMAFLPAAFEQEAGTVETAFTDIGLPEPLAAAAPLLLPLALLGLGVILLATRQRPRVLS